MQEFKFRAWNGHKMLTMQELFALPQHVWIIAMQRPETRPKLHIMQYIRRKDVNNKEIYEGDIISAYQDHGTDGVFGPHLEEVKWSPEHSSFTPFCYPYKYCDVKIIGNIFETIS